jgi:hypothetical protein
MTIPRNPIVTKTDKVRQALRDGRDIDALRIAKGFRKLGQFKTAIQRGWDAYQNPRFTRQLGRDPEQTLGDAITALRTLYGDQPA